MTIKIIMKVEVISLTINCLIELRGSSFIVIRISRNGKSNDSNTIVGTTIFNKAAIFGI